MSRMLTASALACVATFIAAPILAQWTIQPGAPGTTVPSEGPAAAGVGAGRLHKTDGGWRSSRIVGAPVYNDNNQSVGTVDDLIVGKDGKINTAVISVGGFLGIGSKLIRVPYDQMRFEERTPSETSSDTPANTVVMAPLDVPAVPTAIVVPNATTTRIVLPGASKDALTSMPTFDYGT